MSTHSLTHIHNALAHTYLSASIVQGPAGVAAAELCMHPEILGLFSVLAANQQEI